MEMNNFSWFDTFDRKIKPCAESSIFKIRQAIRTDPDIKMVSTFHLFAPSHIARIKRTWKSYGLFHIYKFKFKMKILHNIHKKMLWDYSTEHGVVLLNIWNRFLLFWIDQLNFLESVYWFQNFKIKLNQDWQK